MPKRSLLNKIIINSFFIIVMVFLFGCNKKVKFEQGIEPQNEFSLNSYYQDGMVLLHSDHLILNGQSEKGVVIVAEIVQENGNIYEYNSCITDSAGNWEILLDTPKASNNNYEIKIYDSVKKYSKVIENVKFGNVYLIMGEDFLNEKSTNSVDLTNVSLYTDGKWSFEEADVASKITSFASALSGVLDDNIPVGIVQGNFLNTQLGAWVSSNLINNNSELLPYINQVYELLSESDNFPVQDLYQNYFLWNNFILPLENISFKAMLWYQGLTDYRSGINFSQAAQDYARTLSLFFKEINSFLNIQNICLIQTPSYSSTNLSIANYLGEDIVFLREAQSTAAYFNKNIIIPTYEIGNNWKISDLALLIGNRLTEKEILLTPSYANCIITESKIIIEISNCNDLEDVDKIENLEILDNKGNNIIDNLEISLKNNQIIIIRAFSEIDETGKSVYTKYSISAITYNYQVNNENGNLFNEELVAVAPFKITLNEE